MGWNREKSHVTAHCSGFTLGSVRQTVLSHVEDGQVRVLELYPETNFLAILWPLSGDTVRDGWNREKSHVTAHSSAMSAVMCFVANCCWLRWLHILLALRLTPPTLPGPLLTFCERNWLCRRSRNDHSLDLDALGWGSLTLILRRPLELSFLLGHHGLCSSAQGEQRAFGIHGVGLGVWVASQRLVQIRQVH